MKFTQRGASVLWTLLQKKAKDLGNFALLFMHDYNDGHLDDARGKRYWKGGAAFLREWAATLNEYADNLDEQSSTT